MRIIHGEEEIVREENITYGGRGCDRGDGRGARGRGREAGLSRRGEGKGRFTRRGEDMAGAKGGQHAKGEKGGSWVTDVGEGLGGGRPRRHSGGIA